LAYNFETSLKFEFLRIGTTEEVFLLFGKQLSLRDLLKSLDREGAILFAMPLNVLPGSGIFMA